MVLCYHALLLRVRWGCPPLIYCSRSVERRVLVTEGGEAALTVAAPAAVALWVLGGGAAPPLVLPAGEAVGVDSDPQKAMELLLLSSSCLPQV